MPGWVLSTSSPRVTLAKVADNCAPFNSDARTERGQRRHALDAGAVHVYAVALCSRDACDSLAGTARPFGTGGCSGDGMALVEEYPLPASTGWFASCSARCASASQTRVTRSTSTT